MTAYEDRLIAAQLAIMDKPIEAFLDTYAQNRNNPDQKTVLFFPGGLASELVRARLPFDRGDPSWDTLWVDLFEIFVRRGALALQMNGNQDSEQRLIVPSGPLQSCAINPYDDFIAWCQASRFALLTVPWDFRRSADWNINYFLGTLVPEIERRAASRGWRPGEPLGGATMIGHSFGGMLVKWILNEHEHPFCKNLGLAITVGAPFYGTASQIERLYRSEPELGPPLYDLAAITKVISTMPGGYSLFFLDSQTYDAYGLQLSQDQEEGCALDRYPSFDADDPVVRVDPYVFQRNDPQDQNRGRFPIVDANGDWTWFESYLAQGRNEFRRLVMELHDSVRGKFHNIRGVQLRGGVLAAETKIMHKWGWYTFNGADRDTVIESFGGAGDGVIPAWSARLVTQPSTNVHTIRGEIDEHLEHGALLDFPGVRDKLLELMQPHREQASATTHQRRVPKPAPPHRLHQAKARIALRALRARLDDREERNERVRVQNVINEMGLEEQQALMLRWYIEHLKGHPPSNRPMPDRQQGQEPPDQPLPRPDHGHTPTWWTQARMAIARLRRLPLPIDDMVPLRSSRLWRQRRPR